MWLKILVWELGFFSWYTYIHTWWKFYIARSLFLMRGPSMLRWTVTLFVKSTRLNWSLLYLLSHLTNLLIFSPRLFLSKYFIISANGIHICSKLDIIDIYASSERRTLDVLGHWVLGIKHASPVSNLYPCCYI